MQLSVTCRQFAEECCEILLPEICGQLVSAFACSPKLPNCTAHIPVLDVTAGAAATVAFAVSCSGSGLVWTGFSAAGSGSFATASSAAGCGSSWTGAGVTVDFLLVCHNRSLVIRRRNRLITIAIQHDSLVFIARLAWQRHILGNYLIIVVRSVEKYRDDKHDKQGRVRSPQ